MKGKFSTKLHFVSHVFTDFISQSAFYFNLKYRKTLTVCLYYLSPFIFFFFHFFLFRVKSILYIALERENITPQIGLLYSSNK